MAKIDNELNFLNAVIHTTGNDPNSFSSDQLEPVARKLDDIDDVTLQKHTKKLQDYLEQSPGKPLSIQQIEGAVPHDDKYAPIFTKFFQAMKNNKLDQAPASSATVLGSADIQDNKPAKNINIKILKDENGKRHLEAKFYDDNGKDLLNDKTLDSTNMPDNVDKTTLAKMMTVTDMTKRMALINALRSPDHDTAQAAINALASGDQDKLDKAIAPAQPATPAPGGGTDGAKLSTKEQMLQDIIDTGVAPERVIRAKLELGSDEYIKQYHDTIKSMANNHDISSPNAKTEALAAADTAAGIVDAKRSSVVHTTPQYDDLKEIAGLMGKPDLAPDELSSNLSDFNYNMGRLSERSLSAFRESLKKAAGANGTIPPDKMKQAIDDAKDAAIKAGEEQAKNQSGSDYLKPGQTKEFIDKAFDKDNNPCAGISPDADSKPAAGGGAPQNKTPLTEDDLDKIFADGQPHQITPEMAEAIERTDPIDPVHEQPYIDQYNARHPGNQNVQAVPAGGNRPNGRFYSFKSDDPVRDRTYTGNNTQASLNENSLNTNGSMMPVPSSYDRLNLPTAPSQAGQPTTAPAAPGQNPDLAAQQRTSMQDPNTLAQEQYRAALIKYYQDNPNAAAYYPPPAGLVTVSYGGGGYYGGMKGQPGYTIPGTDALHIPGTDATHVPGYEGASVPGTDAYRNPPQQGASPQSSYPFNQPHAPYAAPYAGGGRWGHGGPSPGGGGPGGHR